MSSDWLMNSTMTVPSGLGPTARPWSGGLTSPAPPKVGEFAEELMAQVRPSKPWAPATLPANPRTAAALRADGRAAFMAAGLAAWPA